MQNAAKILKKQKDKENSHRRCRSVADTGYIERALDNEIRSSTIEERWKSSMGYAYAKRNSISTPIP